MKPQKQLLQFVMLALLSVVSVLVTSNESYAALDCTQCHGTVGSNRPLDTTYAAPASYRNITTGAFKGSHVKHLATAPAAGDCTACHNNTGYGPAHRDGDIQMASGIGYGKVSPFPQTATPTLSTCSTASCHAVYTDVAAKGTPTWGSAADCNSCHDTTPATNAHSAHLAVPTVTCATCHTNPGATGHVNGAITVDNTLGYPASIPKHASTPASFTSTCTASCHDVGGAALDRGKIPSPVWSADVANCTACHALSPVTGSHMAHLQTVDSKQVTCGVCHTGAVQGSNGGTSHLDGNIDTVPAFGYTQDKPKGSAFATCSTLYCHSNVQGVGGSGAPTSYKTPTWGGSVTCNSCHQGSPSTGTHAQHSNTTVMTIECFSCHIDYGSATHADGTITLTPALQAQYSQDGTPGNGYGTCSAASCHDAGRGLQTAAWGATGAPACSACHAVIPATGSHVKHVSTTAYAPVACGQCHTGAVQSSNAGTAHLDTNIDTIPALGYQQNKAKNSAFTSCATTYCHSSAQGAGNDPTAAVTYKAATWGTPLTNGCSSCHEGSATLASGSHRAHLDKVGVTAITCADCHTAASAVTHVDGLINVGGTKVTAVQYNGTPAPGNAYGSCSTSTCHSGNGMFPAAASTWGTQLDCTGCHSFPTATSYHTGITTDCNSCHPNVSSGNVTTTTITVPSQHMDGVVQGGKCDSCHGYPPVQSMAGKGTNASYSSAKLQNYSGGGGAHSVAGHLALTLKTSNGGSFDGCLNCHPNNQHNGGAGAFLVAQVQVTVPASLKFNAGLPITYDRTGGAGSKTTGTCSNVSCHFKATPVWSTETFTQGH